MPKRFDTMNRARALLGSVIRKNLKPRTRLNAWRWSEKHVELDGRFSAIEGPYDAGYTPYLKLLHEWFSDPFVTEISFEKPRQVGGTTLLANCMMYAAVEDPGPILYVTSTGNNAQGFAEREWFPRIELCKPLRELKPDNEDDFKKTEQHFKSCTAKFVGAQSTNNVMSRPIRYLFEDEIDTWPQESESEAPTIEIAEACTISYGTSKKIMRVSTPTVPTGAIHVAAERGSRHRLEVLSPFAPDKPRFELKLDMLNFHKETNRNAKTGRWNLDNVRKTVTLICPYTAQQIPMSSKAAMVEEACEDNRGWRQTNPDAPSEHKSAQISALYSPMMTWGDLAVLFLQRKDTPGGLQDIYNHYLGLPWERKKAEIKQTDIERIVARSPAYDRPEIGAMTHKLPFNLNVVLMLADVQQHGFWWGQSGLRVTPERKLEHYILDWGQAGSFFDLETLFEREFLLPNGERIKPYQGLIDSGYAAKRESGVYEFCLANEGEWWPCQGRTIEHGLLAPVRETIFTHKGIDFEAIQFRDDLAKEELYINRIKEDSSKTKLFLPVGMDITLITHWLDEKLVSRKTERGAEKLEWHDSGNNHLGDVFKQGIVAEWLLEDPLLNPEDDGDEANIAKEGAPPEEANTAS